ncbi:Uncharacterised protein [Vibrio cholerae]|nr:Uncharacterised protein [Vibrio cholerae]
MDQLLQRIIHQQQLVDTGSATVTFVVTFRAARCTIKDQRFFFLAIKQFALLFVRLVRLFAIWA